MAELDHGHEPGLDERIRRSLAVIAPPATSGGVLQEVRRRVSRRRRRVREGVGAVLVVLVGGGAAVGLALTGSPPMTAAPPAHVTTVPRTTAPTRSPSTGSDGNFSSAGTADQGLSRPAPEAPPCPAVEGVPSMEAGRFCGPSPGPGSGLGPGGTCTGTETAPPCGAGVVPGRFYAYTVLGTCSGLLLFDARQWVSELPPPNPVPAFDVWIQLGAGGTVRWIAPTGSVGLVPYTGQPLAACRG
jgi:hypothetical protein